MQVKIYNRKNQQLVEEYYLHAKDKEKIYQEEMLVIWTHSYTKFSMY